MLQSNKIDSWVYIYLMPKIEEVEKETYMQVRKTRYNMATTSGEKVVDKPAGK